MAIEALDAKIHFIQIGLTDLVHEIANCRYAIDLIDRAIEFERLGLDISKVVQIHVERESISKIYTSPLSRSIREFLKRNRGSWQRFRDISDHVIECLMPDATYAERVLLIDRVSRRLASMRGKIHAFEVRPGKHGGSAFEYRFTDDAASEAASRLRNSNRLKLEKKLRRSPNTAEVTAEVP